MKRRYVIVPAALMLFSAALHSSLSAEPRQDNTLQCQTCTENCEAMGLVQGERYCTGPDGLTGGMFVEDAASRSLLDQRAETPQSSVIPVQALGQSVDRIQVSAVEWSFVPIVETIDATGFVSPVQAQQTLQARAQDLAECFRPRDYRAGGRLIVDLYLSYVGAPQGVRGMTDGIAPGQARCILSKAWGYTFPAPEGPEVGTARVRYQVSFMADQRTAEPLDPTRPQLLVERVEVEDGQVSPQALSEQLRLRAFDVRQCHVMGLEALPSDLIVADVEMDFRRRTGIYQASAVDITLINETGTTLPPHEMVECVRQALSVWYAELPQGEAERFKSRFFLTFRPATGM
jgi:hypothetical protein